MLLYVKQNIFESPAQVIVNAVNTVGVMGKGIAKQYKLMYPEMYEQYRYFCETDMLDIGKLWLYKHHTKWILNFPTKKNWRNPSKVEYIEAGLKKFVATYEEKGIYSASFPQLGTGNGGLDWESEVKPLFDKYLKPLPIDIFIHIVEKGSTFEEHKSINETKKWLQNEPSALSADYVWEDILVTLDKNDWKQGTWEFEVNLDNSFENISRIIIKENNKITEFYKDDLYDAWIKLRDYGYLFINDFPESDRVDGKAKKITQLLTILPYIEFIQAMDQQHNFIGVSIRKIDLPTNEELNQKKQMELLFG